MFSDLDSSQCLDKVPILRNLLDERQENCIVDEPLFIVDSRYQLPSTVLFFQPTSV